MAIQERSFWDTMGPGMLQLGGGFVGQRMAANRAEADLRKAQGPLYDKTMNLAGQSLSLAGGMDPQAMAAQRFAQQQALLAPGQEADVQALMRQLAARGQLGVASHGAVAGTAATPGVPMNPQLAALYAAQAGAKAKSAYDSQREGEAYLDSLLRRSGMLQGQAQTARSTGQTARNYMPGKPSIAETLLKGGMNLLKDKQVQSAIGGMLGNIRLPWSPATGPAGSSGYFNPEEWMQSGGNSSWGYDMDYGF